MPTTWRSFSRTATWCPPRWSTTHGKLLGRITVDDVVDVIREEAAHEVMSAAGLGDEEDVFAGIIPSTRRRLVWLGINLVTAFMAAAVVSRFEGTIEKVAALAALMPIVASMGGIAGTQTVTLIIRGIALGQIEWVNARWLLWKEIAVGGLNGLIWAVVVGAVTIVWYGTWKIAAIIAAATLINLLAAAAVGVIVPLMLRRMRIDPALSAGVILTTFTDCIGFATLLGLGRAVPDLSKGLMFACARFRQRPEFTPFDLHADRDSRSASRARASTCRSPTSNWLNDQRAARGSVARSNVQAPASSIRNVMLSRPPAIPLPSAFR